MMEVGCKKGKSTMILYQILKLHHLKGKDFKHMLVKELVNTCCNIGVGRIRIINKNNYEDNVLYNGISELSKVKSLYNREVVNWEFVPKKQIGAIEWEFVLEILV